MAYLDCDTTPPMPSRNVRGGKKAAIHAALRLLDHNRAVGQVGVYSEYLFGEFYGYAIRDGASAYFEAAEIAA